MVPGDSVGSNGSNTSKSSSVSTTSITLAASPSCVGFEEVAFPLAMC